VNLIGLLLFHGKVISTKILSKSFKLFLKILEHGHSHGGKSHGHSHGGGGSSHGHSHSDGHGHGHSHLQHGHSHLAQLADIDDNENDAVYELENSPHANSKTAKTKKSKPKNLNMHGVFLHVLADALGSVVVIVSALVIWLTEWEYKLYVDPALSVAMVCLIMWSTWPLCKWKRKINTFTPLFAVHIIIIYVSCYSWRSARVCLDSTANRPDSHPVGRHSAQIA
jgi:Co/Zn/Cd efflux system component